MIRKTTYLRPRGKRVILIGERNPHSGDPRMALHVYPRNGSGNRLWRLFHLSTGMSKREYLDVFVRRNIGRGTAAVMKKTFLPGDCVVLLGDYVRRSFGIPKVLIHPVVVDGIEYRQIPHPSGMCRLYNDEVLRTLVSMMLGDLYYRFKDNYREIRT